MKHQTHNYGNYYYHTIGNAQTECCSHAGISHTAEIAHMELSHCKFQASCHFHSYFIVIWLQKYESTTPNIFCVYPVYRAIMSHLRPRITGVVSAVYRQTAGQMVSLKSPCPTQQTTFSHHSVHKNLHQRTKPINWHLTYAYWTVHHLDIWIIVDQLDDTCFIIYCSTCFRR